MADSGNDVDIHCRGRYGRKRKTTGSSGVQRGGGRTGRRPRASKARGHPKS